MVAELTDALPLEKLLFVDLKEPERTLFERVHALDSGCKVLRFLHDNANAILSAEDIAFQVQDSLPVVIRSLNALVEFRLVTRHPIEQWEFFGLAVDPAARAQVHALFVWQDRLHTQLARIGQVVNGESRKLEE